MKERTVMTPDQRHRLEHYYLKLKRKAMASFDRLFAALDAAATAPSVDSYEHLADVEHDVLGDCEGFTDVLGKTPLARAAELVIEADYDAWVERRRARGVE